MKHTPGPWKIVGTEIWGIHVRIASGRGAYDEKDRQINKANARLIAAAPDLLEELKDCCTRMERCRSILQDPQCGGNPQSNWGMLDTQKARAAIAKAEATE